MALLKRINSLFYKKAIVLMYHRIATVAYDPSRLCVSKENFEEQVNMLKKSFEVITLPELIAEIKDKRILKNAICITFDDGYADNYLYAKPVLESHHCPATFFIATNFIGSGQLFWWDLLKEIILGSVKLPQDISLVINENVFSYSIKDVELTPGQMYVQGKWYWPAEPPNDRCRLLQALWEQLLPLKQAELWQIISRIVDWAGFTIEPGKERIPMTLEQLESFSSNELFHLGIHTSTHPALPFHEKDFQLMEMNTCKSFLESHFINRVNAIAFPYGRYNDNTLQAMREAGIEAGFTTIGATIHAQSGISILGRMHVCNWKAGELSMRLKKRLNYF